jgi:hypothetical protein
MNDGQLSLYDVLFFLMNTSSRQTSRAGAYTRSRFSST